MNAAIEPLERAFAAGLGWLGFLALQAFASAFTLGGG